MKFLVLTVFGYLGIFAYWKKSSFADCMSVYAGVRPESPVVLRQHGAESGVSARDAGVVGGAGDVAADADAAAAAGMFGARGGTALRPARRLLGALQLRAGRRATRLRRSHHLHHARRPHVPRQPGAAARALAGPHLHVGVRARCWLGTGHGRHPACSPLWPARQPHSPMGHVPSLLPQQARSKKGTS